MMEPMDLEPDPNETPEPDREPTPEGGARHLSTLAVVGIAVVALVVATLIGFAANNDDESELIEAIPSFPPTTAPPSTTTTLAPELQTTLPEPVNTTAFLWPAPASSRRFDDPGAAARSFAVELVGFADPLLGELVPSPGSPETGTLEVRTRADGPVTTVDLQRNPADASWWVTGASTPNIVVDDPRPLSVVSSPVGLRGLAWAFEGTVDVSVHADDVAEPLGTGVVTGSGDQLGPFDGPVEFSAPTASAGSIVFTTLSAEDGSVQEATVVRVLFDAG